MNTLSPAVELSAFIFSVELSVELAKHGCALSEYCVSNTQDFVFLLGAKRACHAKRYNVSVLKICGIAAR